jgi:DNA-binding transcriptional LysR family regulator
VLPTEAGGELLRRLVPVLQDLDEALDAVTGEAGAIGGTLRINCGAAAAELLLSMAVSTFAERCPGVELDLVTDGRMIDIVEAGSTLASASGRLCPRT